MKISPEMFVKIWQTAQSFAEVVEKTNMSVSACRGRVANYRSKGIPLKNMSSPKRLNNEQLIALAESLNKEAKP